MELDKAFEFAVILAWDDLMKAAPPGPARVVYDCKAGTSLDSVSVWSTRAWGYYDLLCDYGTRASSAHPSGTCFRDGYYSDKLEETLDFIMKNQDQFTRPADACRDGLVLISSPTGDERTAATAWMRTVGTPTERELQSGSDVLESGPWWPGATKGEADVGKKW